MTTDILLVYLILAIVGLGIILLSLPTLIAKNKHK